MFRNNSNSIFSAVAPPHMRRTPNVAFPEHSAAITDAHQQLATAYRANQINEAAFDNARRQLDTMVRDKVYRDIDGVQFQVLINKIINSAYNADVPAPGM